MPLLVSRLVPLRAEPRPQWPRSVRDFATPARYGSRRVTVPSVSQSPRILPASSACRELKPKSSLAGSRHFGPHSSLAKAPQPGLTGQAALHQHAVCQDASWSGQSHRSHATLKSISPLLDRTRFFGTGQIQQQTTCWAATPEPPPWRRLRRQWHPAASAVCGHSFCLTASDRGMPCGA